MDHLLISQQGKAGRITLNRPKAFNAMNYEMCLEIEQTLDAWRDDPRIALVILDAAGEKAFCAGGDINELYHRGTQGDFEFGKQFWRDEYRLNQKIADYPKPIFSFMQGFTMGGGVGLGCHASHCIVCETSNIAMPEVGIGLVPDVGGSYILARAPGVIGAYLGLTGTRMEAADAIYVGFADYFAPVESWPEMIEQLCRTGDPDIVKPWYKTAEGATLGSQLGIIQELFGQDTLGSIATSLRSHDSKFAERALRHIERNCPLAMSAALEMQKLLRPNPTLSTALELEYRFTSRAQEHSDFLEGIRAAVIDKDRAPKWRYDLLSVPEDKIAQMIAPLPEESSLNKDQKMRVGFIGLGNMGAPMAKLLAEHKHKITGFDLAAYEVSGVAQAASAQDAVQGAEIVITMLPNGIILRQVVDDILPVLAPNSILIDCSTIDVATSREVAELCSQHDISMLDAPVSGGTGGAAAGTLTFMVGGERDAFDKAQPFFDIMGQKAVYCGAAGNGQSAKICNNMILGATMIATSEAFVLADKLGLDRQAMFDVVSTSSGYSWSMNTYCPAPGIGPKSPADNDYKPGFAAELMLKDLRLSQDAAHHVNADTPMGSVATQIYEAFVEQEDGRGRDFSAVLPRFAKRERP